MGDDDGRTPPTVAQAQGCIEPHAATPIIAAELLASFLFFPLLGATVIRREVLRARRNVTRTNGALYSGSNNLLQKGCRSSEARAH